MVQVQVTVGTNPLPETFKTDGDGLVWPCKDTLRVLKGGEANIECLLLLLGLQSRQFKGVANRQTLGIQ